MKNTAEKKLKVLCLHGYGYSGAYLKMRLQVWPSNVLETMDFVFIDAPFPSTTEPDSKFTWYDQVVSILYLNLFPLILLKYHKVSATTRMAKTVKFEFNSDDLRYTFIYIS